MHQAVLTRIVADCCNVSISLTGKQNGQFQFLSTVVTRMALTRHQLNEKALKFAGC